MKTFLNYIYLVLVVILMSGIFAALASMSKSLEQIAMETRIANEIAICVADPNCTPNSEM